MLIQILGTGCPKCKLLAERVEDAAGALALDASLEKVTDISRILSFGVMMTPALVVDGEVRLVGKVPDLADLMALLKPSDQA